jgi:serine/threonine-protein kinase
VSDDAHLWTDRYTVELVSGEIFRIQAEIAEQVAQALDVTLLEPERQRLAARPTDDLRAYDFYTRGNDYYNRSDDEQHTRIAIQMYERATELDPDFAVVHARLSIAHAAMWWHFYDRTQERLAAAREAVDHALRLDPDLPEAHEALGWYHYWGHLEHELALAEFAIAQQSQPNSSKLFEGIGNVLRRQGEFEQAVSTRDLWLWRPV